MAKQKEPIFTVAIEVYANEDIIKVIHGIKGKVDIPDLIVAKDVFDKFIQKLQLDDNRNLG